jgi:hypothetical protein
MDIYFITYSDEKFKDQQNNLDLHAEKFFNLNSYNREWLVTTNFYKENKEILDLPRGGGYWLWKPFIILDTLNKMNDNDLLFYLDSGDKFSDGLSQFLNNYFSNNDIDSLLTFGGQNKQKWYTKRDTFILMDCDTKEYHNHLQLEAGIICLKKTDKIVKLVSEWLNYCSNPNIITDIENITGPNLHGFKDHRHDQSVLTNLAIKHNLNINRLLRNFITCNVNK